MFFLAWRQLTSHKKQTLLILLGISFGTVLFVTISGLQLGMRQYISQQLLNNTAHVLISGAEGLIDREEVTHAFFGTGETVRWILPPYGKRNDARLENYQGWYQRLSQDPDVLDFSPRLSGNALLSNRGFTVSVRLIGTDPARQLRISAVADYVKEGSFSALAAGTSNIVIGSGVARDLGVRVNQFVDVSSSRGHSKPFKVVGIVHFGNEDFDKSIAFADLSHVQTLTHSPGRVSEIAVALYSIDLASDKAAQWRQVGTDKVQDWQEANKMFMEMIRVQDYTRYFITGAILVVAGFGVYNVLTIMMNQKKPEIAILRAIGYGPEKILRLILYQGLVLGFSGGILGIVLGYLLCLFIGSIDLNIEIGGSNNLILNYDWQIYVTAFAAANAAAIVASLLPARAASLLTPMAILRGER